MSDNSTASTLFMRFPTIITHANIMNDLQSIMKMSLIQHYESLIIGRPQGIASTVKSNFTDGVPKNYELCIMNYELIQTRTSVRLYERAFSPDVWIFPTIMHYALRIMNSFKGCIQQTYSPLQPPTELKWIPTF